MTDDPGAATPAQFAPPARPEQLAAIRVAVAEALHPSHFLVSKRLTLEWAQPGEEEIVWEVFQGRLLDASQTRNRQTFESWNLFQIAAHGHLA